jgi:N-acylneuraminate cytidylyltransferase
MKVAVIPARGGSKRIPRKNIRDFVGKPMIAHSIQAAYDSEMFDRVIVSTDDSEIAEIAKKWGAEVPFLRPANLANDFAGTTEVIAHATQWLIDQGIILEAVCCIYATAPFVQANDICDGWKKLSSGAWSYAFTTTEFAAPIFRAFQQTASGGIQMFFPENFKMRSQDLPTALHDAGQFYWGLPEAWLEQRRIFDHWSIPVYLPRWRVQDIDTEEDWQRAELQWKVINPKSAV